MHGDAVSELIRQGYSDAVNKENLRPASNPRIEPIQMEPGNDLKFAAVIEVMPEVTVKAVDSAVNCPRSNSTRTTGAANAASRAQATAELAKAQGELATARMEVDEKSARNADLRRQLLINTER